MSEAQPQLGLTSTRNDVSFSATYAYSLLSPLATLLLSPALTEDFDAYYD